MKKGILSKEIDIRKYWLYITSFFTKLFNKVSSSKADKDEPSNYRYYRSYQKHYGDYLDKELEKRKSNPKMDLTPSSYVTGQAFSTDYSMKNTDPLYFYSGQLQPPKEKDLHIVKDGIHYYWDEKEQTYKEFL